MSFVYTWKIALARENRGWLLTWGGSPPVWSGWENEEKSCGATNTACRETRQPLSGKQKTDAPLRERRFDWMIR
jgi:hypothetical protein